MIICMRNKGKKFYNNLLIVITLTQIDVITLSVSIVLSCHHNTFSLKDSKE